jgi:hypothetical protein
MTRGTQGHAWVVASCVQVDSPTTGTRSAAAGCALAIEAVVGSVAEPYVRAGCAQAVANPAAPGTANDDVTGTGVGHDQVNPTTTGSDQVPDSEQNQDTAD